MTAAHPPIPSFREALASPINAYRAVQYSTRDDMDTIHTKILLDYKCGRQHQAVKRFENLVAELGFVADVPLIEQPEKLDETTASLLIFELLFQFKNNKTLTRQQLWQYADSIAFFDPDDVACHGAIYNLLLVFFLRRGDLAAAHELAKMSLDAYQRCDSAYLQMFIHLHIAFIHFFAGELEDADAALDDAEHCLGRCGRQACESAMIEISRCWLRTERGARLPTLEELRPLSEQITEGEFWPEIFLVLAALQIRAALAEGLHALPDQHSAMEFTLRSRGMQPFLPAMQLLREEFQSGATVQTKGWHPLGLPERQLVLLLPTMRTWGLNFAEDEAPPATMARLEAVEALHKAWVWRGRGRFDLAMEHLVPAMETIEARGFGFLQNNEAGFIADMARECRKRGRFVKLARRWLNQIQGLPKPSLTETQPLPFGLTSTEIGVLRCLPSSTSNKALGLEFGISESTVKFHLKNIYRKLGVHKRRAAIDIAREKGLL